MMSRRPNNGTNSQGGETGNNDGLQAEVLHANNKGQGGDEGLLQVPLQVSALCDVEGK